MSVRLNALHAQHARERVKSNGKLHEVLQSGTLPRARWWEKYFKWEKNLTVAGKVIEKGFVITPTMGLTIVLAFLGTLGWAYRSSTADSRETRDAIIRMETTLNERTRNFERQQDKMESDLKSEKDLAGLFRDQHNKEMWEMKRALSESGIKVKQ